IALVVVHYRYSPAHVLTFSIPELTRGLAALTWPNWHNTSSWGSPQVLIFLLLLAGFAIKVPMFPFHTWLPLAHVEAPTAGSIILAGVLLKMGTYGLLRFAFPLFPAAAAALAPYLAVLAIVGIIYGALVAMVQPDLKKLVAYSSVSHLGFVVLGICALNVQGVQGAVYQMLNHGVSTGALFLIVGMLSDRRHTRLIAEFGGLKKVMPKLVAMFLLVTLASIGLPGLNGFVGEFLVLLGTFRANPRMAAFATTGVILSAVYMLWMFQRVNYGQVTNEKNAKLPDLSVREWCAIAPLAIMVVVMGVLPGLFLKPMAPSIDRTLQRISQGMSFSVDNHRPAGATLTGGPAAAGVRPVVYVRGSRPSCAGAAADRPAPAPVPSTGAALAVRSLPCAPAAR
ncbi:MAG: NADH-quinone oxidoreductase subunit M, partial [Acidobacteriota bacterium]|nr:NADH-quinone oxidoreductase subunit M [Acidobacteriota bacterium]